MAAQKNSTTLSRDDIMFVAEQLGIEVYYSRRDAHTTSVGRQPKSPSKLRFDRDRYNRIQIIAAAFTRLTGIAPVERQPTDFSGFMSRLGMQLDIPAEQPAQASANDAPWDMNTPF